MVRGPGIAPGAQVEVLIQCKLPTTLPTKGILSVNTLETANKNQTVQVGYDFGAKRGFAFVPAGLNFNANTSREDVTPKLETLRAGATITLQVFVDGSRIETFFSGETTITTTTRNSVPGSALTSSFVNSANLDCSVSSWVLELSPSRGVLKTDDASLGGCNAKPLSSLPYCDPSESFDQRVADVLSRMNATQKVNRLVNDPAPQQSGESAGMPPYALDWDLQSRVSDLSIALFANTNLVCVSTPSTKVNVCSRL